MLDALIWLCKYNILYREEVQIDISNLEWMGNEEEMELPGVIHEQQCDTQDKSEQDLGPAPAQTTDVTDQELLLEDCSGGIHHDIQNIAMSPENAEISEKLSKAAKQSNVMEWPYTSSKAISEYEQNKLIHKFAYTLSLHKLNLYTNYR